MKAGAIIVGISVLIAIFYGASAKHEDRGTGHSSRGLNITNLHGKVNDLLQVRPSSIQPVKYEWGQSK